MKTIINLIIAIPASIILPIAFVMITHKLMGGE